MPTSAVAGASFAPTVQVSALDVNGNTAVSFTGAVSLGLGANPSGGTLSGTLTRAASSGTVSFPGVSLDKTGTGYTLRVTAAGLTDAASSPLTVNAGPVSASQSTVSATPAVITASGGASASTITVTARDALGNPVPGATVVLTSTGSGNTVLQPTAPTTAAGVATGTLHSTVAEAKTISATVSGVAVAQTAVITVSPGSPSQLAFTAQPSSTIAGNAITPAVVVAARDSFGNVATGFTSNITVSIATNPGGGALGGTTMVAASGGMATFADLRVDRVGSGYTLQAAAAPGLTTISTAFDVTVGTAASLAFIVQPSNTPGGATMTPAVQVEVRDATGNRVTSATNSITLAIGTNPNGGTLGGSTTVAAVAGVATFGALTIDSAGTGYRLTASAGGVPSGATSAPFDVTVGPAVRLGFRVQPANATGGAVIAPAVQVEIRDLGGNRVTTASPMVTVAIATNANNGTLGGTKSVVAAGGVATFPTLTVDSAGAGYTLAATATGLTAATSAPFSIAVGPAARLGFRVQPSNTAGGATITPAVQVEVRDLGGNRVTTASTSIALAIGTNPAGGVLSGTTTMSAVNGVATFADLSVDKDGAGYTLTAAGGGFPAATSTAFDIAVGAAAKLAFFTQPTSTTGGATIAPAVQVEVQDAGGNRVTAASTSITLGLGANPKSGTLGGTTTQTASNGLATFGNLTVDSAATGYTLTASATGLGGATSNPFNVTVGAAAKLGFLQQPSSTTGGIAITPAVQVEVRDLGGNRVTTASHAVTVAIATNPNGGTLAGTKTIPAASGVASFNTLAVDSAGTGYTLIATATGLTAATSASFNIAVGPAAKLGFRVQPSNAASGATITPPVQVEVQDAGGNRVTVASNAITLAILSNPGGGTLSGTANVSAVSGLATFNSLSIDKSGVGYTLQATASPPLTAATSSSFTISAGGADHLAFFVQPTQTAAGAAIAPAVQVEVQDAGGNRVTSATNSITVAILDNPSGGSLSGTKTVSAVGGVAAFSSLNIDKAGSGYSLEATSAGLTTAISNEFNITAGSGTRLSFIVEPSPATAGVTIVPAVQVEILDVFGNRVGTATNSVTVSLLNAGGATLSGTKTRAAVAGVATFNNLSVDRSGSTYRLRAATSGLTPDTSVTFTITPGAATQLVFTVPPSNAAAGAAISPDVQVAARDGLGNTDPSFTGNITVAIGANPSGGALSGTTVRAAVGGVATFPGLSIDKTGTGYTLTASATGPSGVTSGAFTISVGAAAKLAFFVQPSTANGGAVITPAVQVEIQDAGGNRVTSATNGITLAFGANPGNASLGGTKTRAAASGLAVFNDLSVDSAASGYTLTATATGLTGATSAAFTVAIGPAAQLGFLVQPSNTGAGSPIAPAIQVEVRDLGGNRVTAGSRSIGMAIGTNPAGGTLSGTTSVTSVNGLAAFADLSINNPATGYTLVASATGLAPGVSSGFDIAIGGAAKLAFIVQPGSTTGGATISPAVQVQIQDAGGNPVPGATNSVTLAIAANPNNGSLAGTKTVGGVGGVATFSTLSIDSAGSGYTLSATASGLTAATSATFNITVGPATKLGFSVQPPNGTGGVTLTPAVKVEVQDAGGNRVTGASNSVTVDIGTNPNAGTLSGTSTLSATAGVATFSTLKIDSAGTGYHLIATALGLGDATSNPFNIGVGSATQLGFLVHPSDATAGSAIAPAVKVEVRDAGGNRVTSATTSVTVAIGTNPSGGTLSGTKTVSAVSGVATFSTLSINKSGTGYTLQGSGGGFAPVTSGAFDIAADGVDATLSTLSAATDTIGQCSFSCVAGIHASTVTVTVRDQFGNLVSGSPVVLSANGGGNDFVPSSSGSTDASGVFTAAFNSSVAEAKTISAVAGGVAITQTGTAAVMPVLVGAGDIADCNSVRDDATANQLDSIPGVVFLAGDDAYPNGRAADFANCYEPTWGRHKARTRPVIGNHEYDSSGTAAPYMAYFGPAVADPLGNGLGYYSFDVGTWHVVMLNSDSGVTSPASGQLTWLQNDLVGRTNQCVLAIWHRPLFTSGSSGGGMARIRRLWQALQDAGAEIVINGHDHLYERFAPQDSLGNANPGGIREFIVGTGGGETHTNYVNSPPNVEASDNGNYSRGVLRLTLYARSYRWEFLHAQGQGTYADSGTSACH